MNPDRSRRWSVFGYTVPAAALTTQMVVRLAALYPDGTQGRFTAPMLLDPSDGTARPLPDRALPAPDPMLAPPVEPAPPLTASEPSEPTPPAEPAPTPWWPLWVVAFAGLGAGILHASRRVRSPR